MSSTSNWSATYPVRLSFCLSRCRPRQAVQHLVRNVLSQVVGLCDYEHFSKTMSRSKKLHTAFSGNLEVKQVHYLEGRWMSMVHESMRPRLGFTMPPTGWYHMWGLSRHRTDPAAIHSIVPQGPLVHQIAKPKIVREVPILRAFFNNLPVSISLTGARVNKWQGHRSHWTGATKLEAIRNLQAFWWLSYFLVEYSRFGFCSGP